MNPVFLVPPVTTDNPAAFVDPPWSTNVDSIAPSEFTDLLANGLARIESKLKAADDIATRFAVDDSIPPHQVMIALEEARSSMGLMMQIRARLVQGVTQLMQMQI